MRGIAAASWCVLFASRAAAQTSGVWDVAPQVMTTLAGSTPNSVFGGQATGITHSAIAIRASTDLLSTGRLHLRYSAQLLPIVYLRGVERYTELPATGSRLYVVGGNTSAYGVGLVPIGLDLAVDVARRVRFQVGAGAGIYRFSQHIPLAAGRQRNFSAEWDGTLMFDTGRNRWLQLGMRWKHLSNGFTAYENPGIDNRMVFAGLSFRLAARP